MTDLDTKAAAPPTAKLTFWTMTAMVVGSMVGAGVFSLPRRFAQETGVAGALIAWLVAGTGMLMLAFVFQMLALRRPHLDAGSPSTSSAASPPPTYRTTSVRTTSRWPASRPASAST